VQAATLIITQERKTCAQLGERAWRLVNVHEEFATETIGKYAVSIAAFGGMCA